mmetsp:Transcript_60759/g.144700  ORF Transcript_60759/g.144700 Transcript_60759/m.144700 type:complete len:624 (-) Transcript_60759:19-1890(-)|eukprot:CAMPEP_0178416286 /NCGR_PEP_ID=MMETSP0689_2-20121128/23987_1 /TAXON_ID=160604 /ORGANISM="Amphidinium massartii, Strain CS-259" /LENGTH=623 /DNA_ID=CAMNT_0020037629 /DNA_START=21 /DNA_END=1892 /DNA_ORIENTATION=-
MQRQRELRFEATDYYALLDVPCTASTSEIKKKFRLLALKWHPDKHTEGSARQRATEAFTKLNEAHEVLSKPDERAAYDVVWRRKHASRRTASERLVDAFARDVVAQEQSRTRERERQQEHEKQTAATAAAAAATPKPSSSTAGGFGFSTSSGAQGVNEPAAGYAGTASASFGRWNHPSWTTFRERAAATAAHGPRGFSSTKSSGFESKKSSDRRATEQERKEGGAGAEAMRRTADDEEGRRKRRERSKSARAPDRQGSKSATAAPQSAASPPPAASKPAMSPRERAADPLRPSAADWAELGRASKDPATFSVGELRRSRVYAELRKEQQHREDAGEEKEKKKSQELSESSDEEEGAAMSRRASEYTEKLKQKHHHWNSAAASMRRTISEQTQPKRTSTTFSAAWIEAEMQRSQSDGHASSGGIRKGQTTSIMRRDNSRSPSPEARPCAEFYTLPKRRASKNSDLSAGRTLSGGSDSAAEPKASSGSSYWTWAVHLRAEEEEWRRPSLSTRTPSMESSSASTATSWSVGDIGQYLSEATYSSSTAFSAAAKATIDNVNEGIAAAMTALTTTSVSSWLPKDWQRGPQQPTRAPKSCARCGELIADGGKGASSCFCRHCALCVQYM